MNNPMDEGIKKLADALALDLSIAILMELSEKDGVPAYSQDIKDAFDVLAKLHSKAWFWRLDSVHDGVICTIQNVKRKTYSVRAPTAAQAICECAVRTLEKSAE